MSRSSNSARPRRRRPVLLTVVGLLCAALIAAGIGIVWYFGGIAQTLDGIKRFEGTVFPEESLRPGQGREPYAQTTTGPGEVQGPKAAGSEEDADDKAVDIVLIGADSGDPNGEKKDVESLNEVGRSDTIMWVHIDGDRENVQVMSIMRDTWLPVPGHGDRKINAAFALGGVPTAVATLENMFQARVDHVVAIDMAGFKDLVDALGGVTVNNPREFTSAFTTGEKITFEKGPIELNGEEALVFARERKTFGDGDFTRVENQQLLVKAIVAKSLSRTNLSNPESVRGSIEAFAPYLTFEQSLDNGRLFDLAWSMRHLRGEDIQMSTVPTNGTGMAGDQAVVWPDWKSIRQIGKGIRTGTLDEVLAP